MRRWRRALCHPSVASIGRRGRRRRSGRAQEVKRPRGSVPGMGNRSGEKVPRRADNNVRRRCRSPCIDRERGGEAWRDCIGEQLLLQQQRARRRARCSLLRRVTCQSTWCGKQVTQALVVRGLPVKTDSNKRFCWIAADSSTSEYKNLRRPADEWQRFSVHFRGSLGCGFVIIIIIRIIGPKLFAYVVVTLRCDASLRSDGQQQVAWKLKSKHLLINTSAHTQRLKQEVEPITGVATNLSELGCGREVRDCTIRPQRKHVMLIAPTGKKLPVWGVFEHLNSCARTTICSLPTISVCWKPLYVWLFEFGARLIVTIAFCLLKCLGLFISLVMEDSITSRRVTFDHSRS